MNLDSFYELRSKLVSSTFQAHPIGLNKGKNENSELYDQHLLIQSVYATISFPVVFKQRHGKKMQDLLDTGWSGLYLISDKMKTTLEINRLTGWNSFDIQLLDINEQEIKGYWGLSIRGRCGPIDYSKSEVIKKQFVPNGPINKYYKGMHVGLDKWDGSDFFLPKGYWGTIITQKAADAITKNKLTNVNLKKLSEIEVDEFTVNVASGKLKK